MRTPSVDNDPWQELVEHLGRTTGMGAPMCRRVVEDVFAHVDETVERYLRRRHRELQSAGMTNDAIYGALGREVAQRPFAAPPLTERQIRRAIYG